MPQSPCHQNPSTALRAAPGCAAAVRSRRGRALSDAALAGASAVLIGRRTSPQTSAPWRRRDIADAMSTFSAQHVRIGERLAAYRADGKRIFATTSCQTNSVVLLHILLPALLIPLTDLFREVCAQVNRRSIA